MFLLSVYFKSLLKRILLVLLGISVAILIVELTIRIFVLGYTTRIAYLYKKANENVNNLRILALGESTTLGLWIEDYSYPIQLKKLINNYLKC